jgi:hypothetical protein
LEAERVQVQVLVLVVWLIYSEGLVVPQAAIARELLTLAD